MDTQSNGAAIGSQILPGKGLPQLFFGTSREDVLALLGQPDDIDRYSDEEDFSSETWHYDDLELSLVVEEVEDWRVTTLTVSSDEFTLKGARLIGMSRAMLEKKIAELELGESQYEDWSDDEQDNFELVSIPDQNLNFWLLDGIVSEIQWGVAYNEQDEADWP